LTNETNEDSIDGNPSSTEIHKPPLIFINGVINCGEMVKRVRDIAEDEEYCTKGLAHNVIETNCVTSETNRLKEETASRIVIKYVHH